MDVAKNEFLLKAGEVSKEFYFLSEGCVRLFYYSNGEEKTGYFYTENSFVSSYESYTKQVPAKHNLQAIENCKLVVVTLEAAMQLLAFSPKFDALARTLMEEELIIYQEMIANFITKDAEGRYQELLDTKSELLQRIPQYHLATYLGVTPETLSRIRKRLANS
jgi:CRP-like cAMP-binding protein